MISDYWVTESRKISNVIFGDNFLQDLLSQADELPVGENCLDAVSKMFVMVQKGKSNQDHRWIFSMLYDFVKNKEYAVSQVSWRALQNGLVAKLLYKKQLLEHLLSDAVPKFKWVPTALRS